jgi:hypothetical protein
VYRACVPNRGSPISKSSSSSTVSPSTRQSTQERHADIQCNRGLSRHDRHALCAGASFKKKQMGTSSFLQALGGLL